MNNKHSFPAVFPVTCHTDHVGVGTIFVAIKGMKEDGVQYIVTALSKGARTFVVQDDAHIDRRVSQAVSAQGGSILRAKDTRRELAYLSAAAFGKPAEKLKIIGITGTKGKTTTAFLLEHILKSAGYPVALLSTVKNRILLQEFPAHLTTHQPDYLHAFFDRCVKSGVEWVVMEVAAQAITLNRVAGISFDMLIFTNFSKEHGEFYPTINDYFQAKESLFKQLKAGGICIFNQDDAKVASLKNKFPGSLSFTLDRDKSSTASMLGIFKSCSQNGLDLQLVSGSTDLSAHLPNLLGRFNAYNSAAAALCAHTFGVAPRVIEQALADFPGVPGRLNKYFLANGACAFIDNAHNPSSFEATLSTLRALTNHLIVVFGAGGDRDASRRPLMGAIAAYYSDIVVLTSDNPRSEEAAEIVRQIREGIDVESKAHILVELDREVAIRYACRQSRTGSVIALLGKGPEMYQLVKGVKTYFSEVDILKTYF